MIGTYGDRYGRGLGMLGTRAARVLSAGTRRSFAANASVSESQTAAVGIGPSSVWSGPSRTVTLGPPLLRRARQP
jgi:hypothetical protein